ncbi:hypothetical protein K443DRAFT_662322 [Laccaria amethystina LaAM-08-1]|uniref:Uncharacterized protein n=1 Tax=Laccaria amethystina LaAM-08-1 TaxID=1095629 RepID=A0A0C9XIG4_9AGAR|nr:hypothetical protein K443DRAFT_662322 [Laccaria amethystina LaAM-08-1]
MPIPQAPRSSFSIVVHSGPVSTVLKDYQRARKRDIQLPIYGPFDSLTQTVDLHHTLEFLNYKYDYIVSSCFTTPPHQDVHSSGESGDSGEKPALVVDRSLWSHLKTLFPVVTLLVTQRFLTTVRRD